MKLQDLNIFVVGNPPPSFGGRYFIFVKLVTSCGIVGYGECYAATIGPEAMKAVIKDVFSRHVLGEDPSNIELMFRRIYSSGFSQRPDPTVIGAFSGIEMACWDIMGKALDRPIYKLLGGRISKELRSYTYLYPQPEEEVSTFYSSVEQSVACALRMVDKGFTAIKFDPAGPYTIFGGHQPTMVDINRAVDFCREIRAAIGHRADILFGTHGQFTSSGAIRLAHQLEPYLPLWFEEPVPPDMPEEMARVAALTTIPIATGERLTTKNEFTQLLRLQAANILQPALGRVGGIWEAKKIAIIAESFGAQIAPHLYAGPIEWAANIQLGASLSNLLMIESIGIGEGFHAMLLNTEIQWEKGYIQVPTSPGLGVELNEEKARAFPYTGEKLHLEMQDTPHYP